MFWAFAIKGLWHFFILSPFSTGFTGPPQLFSLDLADLPPFSSRLCQLRQDLVDLGQVGPGIGLQVREAGR